VWTFVMHSRSVLCMTGHYNFYYVCMYVCLSAESAHINEISFTSRNVEM